MGQQFPYNEPPHSPPEDDDDFDSDDIPDDPMNKIGDHE